MCLQSVIDTEGCSYEDNSFDVDEGRPNHQQQEDSERFSFDVDEGGGPNHQQQDSERFIRRSECIAP